MDNGLVFIHGAWMTPVRWEDFESYFLQNGLHTLEPPWPGKEAPIPQQRDRPSETLCGLGIAENGREEVAAFILGWLRDLPA